MKRRKVENHMAYRRNDEVNKREKYTYIREEKKIKHLL